mmetsp:Transcript_40076/g.87520  ORF Transcript_40076/g.87520 Transcript_40076/m.87520 type:complete len:287 (+) Transcript_40076:334-1194(+)
MRSFSSRCQQQRLSSVVSALPGLTAGARALGPTAAQRLKSLSVVHPWAGPRPLQAAAMPRVQAGKVFSASSQGVLPGPESSWSLAHLAWPSLHLVGGDVQGLAVNSWLLQAEPRRATDYELSRGRIVDVLRRDYPDFFERTPDYDIYDDGIVLEVGDPFRAMGSLRGKAKYKKVLTALQSIGRLVVSNGTVTCRVYPWEEHGYALRVPWQCHGCLRILGRREPLHLSAVSVYSLVPQIAFPGSETAGKAWLTHKISRHRLDFLEIHPPSLRSFLLGSAPLRTVCAV